MQRGIFVKDHPYIIPVQFGQIRPSSFRREDFLKSANQNLELALAAMLFIQPERKEVFLWRTLYIIPVKFG